MTTTRRMLPSRRPRPERLGQRLVAERDRQATVAFDHLAAQGLAERRRRLRDLLEQEVRELAAVDVAGGDLGVLQLVLVHRQRRAVERVALDAGERARAVRVEHHHLAAGGGGALGIGRRLAVHAQVGGRLLDQAVGLAGHDVGVLDHAHVEGLATAPERQEQAVGGGGGLGGDAHRARELRHRRAEGVLHSGAALHAAGDEGWDDLGVGGDLGRHLQALERLEVGVVVDVAVERAHHVGTLVTVELLVVERVRVGLGDDADTRPAGVAEHHDLGVVVRECEVQQRVVADRGTQHRGVVAELTDLGGGLVDEGELAVGGAHRT